MKQVQFNSGNSALQEKTCPSVLEITVLGTPGPQGSKKFVGVSKAGRGIMIESSAKVMPWREAVKWSFVQQFQGHKRPAIAGPVLMEVTFSLCRPKSVKRPLPDVKPDLDKLVRSTGDALTEIGAYQDDASVVGTMSRKLYAGSPGALSSPGAVIRIRRAV